MALITAINIANFNVSVFKDSNSAGKGVFRYNITFPTSQVTEYLTLGGLKLKTSHTKYFNKLILADREAIYRNS